MSNIIISCHRYRRYIQMTLLEILYKCLLSYKYQWMMRPTSNFSTHMVPSTFNSIGTNIGLLRNKCRAFRHHTYQELSVGSKKTGGTNIHTNGSMAHYSMMHMDTTAKMAHVSLGHAFNKFISMHNMSLALASNEINFCNHNVHPRRLM